MLFAQGGLDLLGVHQEAAVACGDEHLGIRSGDLGADGSGKAPRHGGQAVRDQARVRRVGGIEPRHPHFEGTGIDEDDVVAAHGGADVGHNAGRCHRETVVPAPLIQFLRQELADLELGGLILEMAVESSLQRVEAPADVGLEPDRDVVVEIDFGGELVNVDDLLVTLGIDAHRIELLEFVPDRHDRIGLVETEVHIVMTHEPDGAERLRMVVREDAFAMERRGDRDAQSLGESDERRTRVGARRSVARQDDRAPRCAEYGCGTSHLIRRRLKSAGNVDRERSRPDRRRSTLDVLGDRQIDRTWALGLRQLERLPDHFRSRLSGGDESGPFRDRCEHGDQIDTLVRFLVAPVHADLRRKGDERRRVRRGVGDARQQVDRTRPERGGTHPRLAAETTVRLGHEGRSLLMAYEHEADR